MSRQIHLLLLGNEIPDVHFRRTVVVGKPVELGSIARGEDQHFAERLLGAGSGEDVPDFAVAEGYLLPHFDRRRAVVHANDEKVHIRRMRETT